MNKTILHWSYHNLTAIPTDLLNYAELEEVYLKENFIVSIPQWLLSLVNLKFIHLLGNLIREIPENIYYLENLEFLDLSNNRVSCLPESIGKLVNLRRFNVGGNEIRVLPKGIGSLKNLEVLDVSDNLLKYLPEEIADLKSLNEIILTDNMLLKSLPNKLVLLPRLKTLCADRCGLLYLPAVLSPSITHIRLFNNPFVTHIPVCYMKHIQRFYDVVQSMNESYYGPTARYSICEEETFRKLIIPIDLKQIYDTNQRFVRSLYELSLAKFTKCFHTPLEDNVSIPRSIIKAINNGPTTCCSSLSCQRRMYTECYLVLIKRLNSTSKLIMSCSFCSIECKECWFQQNGSEYYNLKWRKL